MTKDEALQMCLEYIETDAHERKYVRHAIKQALAAQQTCNCRWEGEVQVQQCTLHEAHVDAIHEWAERAKAAEAKLKAQPAPVQEPVKENTMIYKTFEKWKSGNVLEHGVPRTEYYSEDQLDLVEMGWNYGYDAGRAVEQALDKKAENARELGLDYEPVGEAYLCDKCQTPFDGARTVAIVQLPKSLSTPFHPHSQHLCRSLWRGLRKTVIWFGKTMKPLSVAISTPPHPHKSLCAALVFVITKPHRKNESA
jgi:hypothetical protein